MSDFRTYVDEYKLILAGDDGVAPLEEKINALLQMGWEPFGSPLVIQGFQLCQAMVRYEK